MARLNTIGRFMEESLRTGVDDYISGVTIVQPIFQNYIDKSIGYSASIRENLSNGDSLDVMFYNPEGSGVVAYIISVEAVGLAQGLIDIYQNATITSNGTELYLRSLKLTDTNPPNCKVEYNGTYDTSGAALVLQTVLPGGTRRRAIGSLAEVGETVIIGEGESILVRLTNNSGANNYYSIRIVWWEKQAGAYS